MLAKPGFGALLFWVRRNIDLDRLGLHLRLLRRMLSLWAKRGLDKFLILLYVDHPMNVDSQITPSINTGATTSV